MPKVIHQIKRFWSKVQKSDSCWLWTAGKFDTGYGQFRFAGRNQGAHRLSWFFVHGEIPKGLYVLHKCDNRACVSPDHLWLGTAKDNAMDMARKGRCHLQKHPEKSPRVSQRGELNGHAKLDAHRVRAIRNLVASGLSQRAVAEKFGVRQSSISRVISRNSRGGWAHVEDHS